MVVHAAVPHAFGQVGGRGVGDFELGWVRVVVDAGDLDGLVGGGGVGLAGGKGDLVRGDEDRVGGFVVDACFVIGRYAIRVLVQEGDAWRGTEDGFEGLVAGFEGDSTG